MADQKNNNEKRVLTLTVAIVVATLIGIGIVARQKRDPLLRELLSQQTAILKTVDRVENKIGELGEGVSAQAISGQGADISLLTSKLDSIEQRLSKLETQWTNLQNTVKQQAKGIPARPTEDYSKVHQIDAAHSYVIGKKDAPVTIVEFLDFQCPFCARFHKPLAEIIKQYPNDVNYVVKNFPLSFHPQARPAAKAAFAAGLQGKYEEMANALLDNGKSLSDEKFKEIAGNIGLNVDQFLKDYKDKDAQWEDYIKKDMALGSKIGVRGTPTFFINGRKTRARDTATWKKEIDEILKKK